MEAEPKGSAPRMFIVLTCAPAGKLGFLVTQSNGTIAAFFVTAVFTVLFSITAPEIRDAVSIREALKFIIPSAAGRRMNFLILNE